MESCKQTHFSSLILCLCLTGPPKALDEDETEFLDSLEMVSMWYVGASCSFRATLIVGYVALLTCIKDSMLKQPGAILLFCLYCPKIMLWCSSFYTAQKCKQRGATEWPCAFMIHDQGSCTCFQTLCFAAKRFKLFRLHSSLSWCFFLAV